MIYNLLLSKIDNEYGFPSPAGVPARAVDFDDTSKYGEGSLGQQLGEAFGRFLIAFGMTSSKHYDSFLQKNRRKNKEWLSVISSIARNLPKAN